MRIAFYAPLKPPDHPVASGDRALARALIAALERSGHEVKVASRFRSFDAGDPARQTRLQELGSHLAERLIRRYGHAPSPLWGGGSREAAGGWVAQAPTPQPGDGALPSPLMVKASLEPPADASPKLPEAPLDLWFTYHLYHKAPDWLGPRVSQRLGIPYVAAEASFAPKQAGGKWAPGHRAIQDAIRSAARIVQLNPADAECVLPLLDSPARLIRLAPFVDTASFRAPDRDAGRAALAAQHGIPEDAPWLLAVAMMRKDQKLLSYRALAASLLELTDLPWRLIIAGAGPAEADVHAAFAPLAGRVTWLGVLPPDDLRRLYRAADLYVWPAIKEAFGMTLVEAQAAGLPVVAGRSGGVSTIVADGETGLLPPEGDVPGFAAAVRSLIADRPRRRATGMAAARRAAEHLDVVTAAAILDRALRTLVSGTTP